jgi:hypothetical protein
MSAGSLATMTLKRRRVQPRYTVDMAVQAWDLAKAGSAMTIRVRERGNLIGTIEIGQGSFRWMPAHGKLGLKRIPWGNLCAALNKHYH